MTTFVREDESTWEWFMRCLVAQGDVAQALQVLSQYRQEVLDADSNHRFSPSLLELGGQLSDPSQVAQLLWAPQDKSLPGTPATPLESNAARHIPPLTDVIGRESDRSLLLDLIDQDHRLISIVGLGGVGKTTLLRSIIPDLLPRFNQYVAEKISSPKLKESFLFNPRVHRKVFELYERRFGKKVSANSHQSAP